ncbi:hypothetical protein R1sor_009029 [Riccia sorocarpa]|uniref:Uncharacterized protein n=1 Tax=Riccia sorocarpa TaxID=122646 RepID=A0ABD3H7W2_9MARC
MEYSRVNLGTLLRHAGAEWTGGDIGMHGLSSLESIMNMYRGAGMPSIVRWRLCIGDEDSRHDAIPFGQSSQDEYIQSRGVRCVCSEVPSSGLKRDCESCSERCTDDECRLMRKHMIPFDYLAIGGIIRNLCSYRTLCHSMLSMWRARERWISADRDPAPSFPIMDWWDGTKAKEIAWFFDSRSEFELPVVCQSCYEVYQAHPIKCEELSDEFNFSQDSQAYEFACSSCGHWICADRKTTKLRFSTGGLTGCMRCECLSRWKSKPRVGLGGIVEYHDNRKCYRYPPRARSIQHLEEAAMQIARCESASQRKEVTRRSGVVAKTRAWRGNVPSKGSLHYPFFVLAGAGHMVDDIIRHGPSNIWEDDDGLLPHERAVRLLHSHMRFSTSRLRERTLEDECQPWHSEGVCVVTTQKDANLIWEMASDNRSTICASNILRTGIGIRSKRSKVCSIQRGLKVYLTRFWRESKATLRGEEILEISDRIVQLKTVLIREKVFKLGDHVIVLDETRADLAYEWNWKGRIVSCFYHSCGNKTQMFFEFRWLYNKTESNVQTVDPISGMQLLHPTERSHAYENWRPAMQVAYHFFPIRRHRNGDILALETEEWRDRNFLFAPSAIGHPPPYPKLHDILLACHADDCRFTGVETCVVRRIETEDGETSDNLPQVMEDGLDCTSPR